MTPYPSVSAARAWALIKPYWFGDDRWRGRLLLAVIVGLALAQVYISVLINRWNAVFYNALQDKKFDVFIHQLGIFGMLAACYIATAVYRQYFNQMLHIRWRKWMTDTYQNAWLTGLSYYRLQVLSKSTDNPDQRIADDVDMFTGTTLTLSIGLMSAVVTLLSFITILWGLSGSFAFHIAGHAISIPGYMVWAALLYSVVGTWLTHKIGRRLVRLNFDQQRFEANFRFAMIRVREHAETIAFYHGEAVEQHTLRERFSHILANWWQIMRKQKQLTWFTAGYGQIAIIFPFVVAAPRYFAGAIQLGGLMQTASAFGQVQGALSWFIDVYTQFAGWKAATDRLSSFTHAIAGAPDEGVAKDIAISTGASNALTITHLNVNLPDGSPLITDMNLTLHPGDRLLITGDSGSGKTTMLRALAGLWPYGTGTVTLPQNATLLFIPQKPYLPILSLREIVCYPQPATQYSDTAIAEALHTVGLATLTTSLDVIAHWSQSLSMGEQQKLAFARIFLHKPGILLLDEVTASLDESAEARLYQTLLAQLPQCIIVSIGHRNTLRAFHTSEKPLTK
jgi:putative ATP-binding cassette transporter